VERRSRPRGEAERRRRANQEGTGVEKGRRDLFRRRASRVVPG